MPTTRAIDPSQRPIFGLTSGTARPLTTLGSVQVRESTAHSDYKALTLTGRLRKAWGQVNAAYVLSKSMSDDDNERDSGGHRLREHLQPRIRSGARRASTAGTSSTGRWC